MTDYLDILKKVWGYDSFRGIQREIIESVGRGEDTLGLMPTGGGKSITFQVPTLATDGLCLVITPLISLMRDQVAQLRRRHIKAAAIYTGMSHADVIATLENCIFGNFKFLYVSPERLASELFLKKLSRINICLITVDEAHCISQWGYDFRPSYLTISDLRSLLPNVPMLALTATATPAVVDDIQQQLGFKRSNVYRMSFDRANLVYVVRQVSSAIDEMLHILRSTSGASIVYCRSRERVEEIARILQREGISSTAYHAGMAGELRNRHQQQWMRGEVRVIVATNAFGMGIDKPDVRQVIHIGAPDSLEAYYQEAGRAGRDGQTSYAVLLYESHSISMLRRRISSTFPTRDEIARIYEHICCYLQIAVDDGQGVRREFDVDKFCLLFHHYPATVISALGILQHAGYITFEQDDERASRLQFIINRNDLYRLRNLEGQEEAILNTVLRNYGGVFADEKYINETFIAEESGTTRDDVYNFLTALSMRRVVKYIPMRQVPLITFNRRRVDTPKLFISTEVYDNRREAYAKRIEAMIAYAEDAGSCRGNRLLEYFGEQPTQSCGHCDVCRRRLPVGRQGDKAKTDADALPQAIYQICQMLQLAEDNRVSATALQRLPYSSDTLRIALNKIVEDGIAHLDGCLIVKN